MIWQPISDYPGYEVSDMGLVRSIDRVVETKTGPRNYKGQLLKLIVINPEIGYIGVDLGRGHRKLVHLLVINAFAGPAPDDHECRHLDGNPANNRFSNLKWGTKSENAQDIILHGNNFNLNKDVCPRGHALVPGNCTRFALNKRRRNCLACARAHAYCKIHPELDMQTVSDMYYQHGKGWMRRKS